jgi:hypothetical protein
MQRMRSTALYYSSSRVVVVEEPSSVYLTRIWVATTNYIVIVSHNVSVLERN